jgi:hypothetical protein
MTNSDPTMFDDLERAYIEKETKQKAMVLSIVQAIQDLVVATTDDPQELDRCDAICAAVIAFAFKGRLEPLEPHETARRAMNARA